MGIWWAKSLNRVSCRFKDFSDLQNSPLSSKFIVDVITLKLCLGISIFYHKSISNIEFQNCSVRLL